MSETTLRIAAAFFAYAAGVVLVRAVHEYSDTWLAYDSDTGRRDAIDQLAGASAFFWPLFLALFLAYLPFAAMLRCGELLGQRIKHDSTCSEDRPHE